MVTHDRAPPGSFTGQFIGLRRHFLISGSQPRGRHECAVRPAQRSRNLPARSADHSPSRNNYRASPPWPCRRDRGARPPITVVFRLRQAPRHLRRKGLAIKLQGFGAVRALKPDKTRIWRSLKFWPCGRSTVRHRERHSGHPWRWIECSAGIGPHGAVAVIKVARRVLRSLSPFRWHWDLLSESSSPSPAVTPPRLRNRPWARAPQPRPALRPRPRAGPKRHQPRAPVPRPLRPAPQRQLRPRLRPRPARRHPAQRRWPHPPTRPFRP